MPGAATYAAKAARAAGAVGDELADAVAAAISQLIVRSQEGKHVSIVDGYNSVFKAVVQEAGGAQSAIQGAAIAAGRCAGETMMAIEGKGVQDASEYASHVALEVGGSDVTGRAAAALIATPALPSSKVCSPVANDQSKSPASGVQSIITTTNVPTANVTAVGADQLANLTLRIEALEHNISLKRAKFEQLGAGKFKALAEMLRTIQYDKDVLFYRSSRLGWAVTRNWNEAVTLTQSIEVALRDAETNFTDSEKKHSDLFNGVLTKNMAELEKRVFAIQKGLQIMRREAFANAAFDAPRVDDRFVQEADSFAALRVNAEESLLNVSSSAVSRPRTPSALAYTVLPNTREAADGAKARSIASGWLHAAQQDFHQIKQHLFPLDGTQYGMTGGGLQLIRETLKTNDNAQIAAAEGKMSSQHTVVEKAHSDIAQSSMNLRMLKNDIINAAHQEVGRQREP